MFSPKQFWGWDGFAWTKSFWAIEEFLHDKV
jgi:hypothetical protein